MHCLITPIAAHQMQVITGEAVAGKKPAELQEQASSGDGCDVLRYRDASL